MIFCFIVVPLFLSSCMATAPTPLIKKEKRTHSKLYSLSSGEVINIVTRQINKGKAKIVRSSKTKNGESFSGEFIAIGDSKRTNTRVKISDLKGKTVRGNEYSQTSSIRQAGTGVLVGTKGTVITINYVNDTSAGNAAGTGRDNKGVRYKFTCCDVNLINK